MAKTAWGIETGASTLKAVKLTADGRGNVTIEDYASVQMAQYRSAGADDSVAIVGALRELVASKGIKPSDTAYVSLAGRHAFSRVITLPPVGEDAMRETIANEARGQIPIKLEDAVWDYQRISGGEGEVQVNLYAVKRDVVTQLLNACRSAGLPIKGIQLAPLGIYNFVKHELDPSLSAACVCVDIGAENTDLLIVDGEKTWIRVVPFAGNDVTKALLMKDKRLNPAMAESLKRDPSNMVKKFNESKPDPIWKDVGTVVEAMKPPLRELVAEINRSVGFYKSQNDGADFRTLVTMGNGSRLINLQKFFEQQLQYRVFAINELTRISVGRALDPGEIQSIAHTLAVPIGVGLQAVGIKGLASTNLIPQELVAEEAAAKLRPLAIVGGAAMFVAGAVSLMLSMSAVGEASEREEELKRLASQVQSRKGEEASILRGDVYREAYATSLNNVMRGSQLAGASYDLLTDTVERYRAENRNLYLFHSKFPNDERAGGVVVRESSHRLVAPVRNPEEPGPFAEDDLGPYNLARETDVIARASLATPLDQISQEQANDHANRLRDRLRERLKLILRPEAEVNANASQWNEAMSREFGEQDSAAFRAARVIREEVGPVTDADLSQMVQLAGGLVAATLDDLLVATQAGGSSVGQGEARIFPAREYFHLDLQLRLKGRPWLPPAPPKTEGA